MSRTVAYGPISEDSTVVSLDLAKKNSRIDWNEEDDLLEVFLQAVALEIENYIGQPVLRRKQAVIQDTRWRSQEIPFQVNELMSVQWVDNLGNKTTVDKDQYDFFGNELTLTGSQPQDFSRLEITVDTGYSSMEMPADLKRAALLLFSEADTYRENRPIRLNSSAKAVLRPRRRY